MLSRQMDPIWKQLSGYKSGYQPDVEAGLRKLHEKMEDAEIASFKAAKPRRTVTWALLLLLVILLGFALWFLFFRAGVQTHATPSGGHQAILLEEGLQVILNEESRLEFRPGEDLVFLSGEAYFDIAPRPTRPLRIETADTRVTVLGTAFNLRARPEEAYTEVEMESGRVAFQDKASGEKTTVNAQQRGRCWASGKGMTVEPAPHGSAHFWRTRQAHFVNQPLHLVLEEMERHFDLTIDGAEALGACRLTLSFEGSGVQDIFKALERILGMQVDSVGPDRYYLRGGNCQ